MNVEHQKKRKGKGKVTKERKKNNNKKQSKTKIRNTILFVSMCDGHATIG